MAAGGYTAYPGYPGYYSRPPSAEYPRDQAAGAYHLVNPEYNERFYGAHGYEGQRAGVMNAYEQPEAKRRKVDGVTICVDYVRGFCVKGNRCPKPHVDYVESIDEREILAKVKFCHDYQNKGVCVRKDCKFLHVTRREEDEFLLTGTIPKSVFDRMREWTQNQQTSDINYEFDPSAAPGGYSSNAAAFNPSGGFPSAGRGRADVVGGGVYAQRKPIAPRRPSVPMGGSPGVSGTGGTSFGASGTHPSSQPVTYSNFCIDFLKGTCVKGANCTLRHLEIVDTLEDREGIVKSIFCHDFQNKRCPRHFCKYIHATRAEETFFLDNGFFPPTLNEKNHDKMFFSDTCIDHLRNQCIRGQSCQFKHVNFVESQQERVTLSRSIFCHDFQESSCKRPNCKLVHTGKTDEQYFLRTGTLPDPLRIPPSEGESKVDVSHLVGNVCREFVKNQCTRGATCRYYHPTPDEIQALVTQQQSPELKAESPTNKPTVDALMAENEELKKRVEQMERLLADACHCITLAVGDQNPTVAALMKAIGDLAPTSSLANHEGLESKADGDNNGGGGVQ